MDGASSGQQTRKEGDDYHDNNGRAERERIVGTYLVKPIAEQARERECGCRSQDQTAGDQDKAAR